MKSSIYAKVRY